IRPGWDRIEGILFPSQEGETKEPQKTKPGFVLDKAVYSSRTLISSDTVRIEPVGKIRGKSLANLLIKPVRYNPHSNNLEVITSMRIEIVFSKSSGAVSKAFQTESRLFTEFLQKGILDFNPDDVITGYTEEPVTMVIMTDTVFRKHLQPFLKWKTQKGYRLKVLYRGDNLAGNSYSELKDTLTAIYNASSVTGTPPEYLLIIGDVNKVPYYGTENVTDMYYGEFDGNGDYIPEMFIGRLPVADTSELKAVIQKIIQYEKFEFADTNRFYSRSLITAGYDAGYSYIMNGQINYAITNYLTPQNKINEYHFYYPQSYTAKDSVIKLVNNGVSFLNYTGHGDASGWLHLNIKVPDIPSFTNSNMYPFVISNACGTSRYNLSSSFGNKMVLTEGKGAIGFIGCSNDSYWDEDFYWAIGVGTPSENPTYETTGLGVYDRLFHTHNESPSDWFMTMGQVTYAGNLSVSGSTSSRKKYYWEIYNLVGDPSIIPMLGTPDSFSIELPDTLPNNTRLLTLDADPFSYAAVSHFDTLWDARFASPSGSVMLDLPGLTDDSCLVVITGQNKVPLIKTIYFSDINREFVDLAGFSINDSSENVNGLADFGESVFLSLRIGNLGLKDAGNLYATIESASEWIDITNDSVMIGTLAALSEINLNDDFSITVAGNIPDKAIATINLKLKDSAYEKHFKIDICIHAPGLEILSCRMDDSETGNGNGIADPGETFNLVFRIENNGSSNTSGQFDIVSTNPDISLLQPSIKSGILQFGETTSISMPVKLSESVSSGSYITVQSTIDCNPYFADKSFTFRVGRIRESFESSNFRIFPWVNIGLKPWIITANSPYEGSLSARSGVILHNESSSLKIRVEYTEADSLKFFYKVSSENNYDYLIFKVNGKEVFRKSGETVWEKKVIPMPAGFNEMEWIYRKDQSVSNGQDCAYIDMIDFAGPGSVRYVQRDIEVARIASPLQKEYFGVEPVSVKVLNQSPDTIYGFNMAYILNNGSPVRQHFNNTLIPFGDSVTVTFSSPADLTRYGIYSITAYGYNNSDDFIFNDTLKIEIRNTDINKPLWVFPNPFTTELKIIVNSNIGGTARITLASPGGNVVSDFEYPVIAGENIIILNDSRLAPSVYYLKVELPGAVRVVSVLKAKR
ncbi:MAG: hypothetical protein IQL11_03800, partial [Bacteroidales bacterium]|nr:hypothetical protein [Bacteroidales bacterium]